MRYVDGIYTVFFYRQGADGQPVEVNRFPASADMVEAYRLAPEATLSAARRNQGGHPIDGLRILSPAGTTMFRYTTAAIPCGRTD